MFVVVMPVVLLKKFLQKLQEQAQPVHSAYHLLSTQNSMARLIRNAAMCHGFILHPCPLVLPFGNQ